MRERGRRVVAVIAVMAGLAAGFGASVASAAPTPAVVFDSITNATHRYSLGFQANGAAELGDYVHLGGTDRALRTVTVTMVDFGPNSSYPLLPAIGWDWPVTLNVYSVAPGSPNTVGALLGTVTQTFTIPWYAAFNITFDLSTLNLTLPDNVIVGVAFNTQSWGANPVGVPGPYASLNVGDSGVASVGSDDDPDKVFWNSSVASRYADGGAGGVGHFVRTGAGEEGERRAER